MHRLYYASIAALALAITGCSGDSDETPDITEAIPLEVDEPASADGAGETGETGETTQNGSGDTPALPGSGDANGAAGEQRGRSIPDTMEAGSNPPDFEVPKGSKVQRAN